MSRDPGAEDENIGFGWQIAGFSEHSGLPEGLITGSLAGLFDRMVLAGSHNAIIDQPDFTFPESCVLVSVSSSAPSRR